MSANPSIELKAVDKTDPPEVSDASPRRRRLRILLLGVVPMLALPVVAVVYLLGGRYVETDNAYVKAEMVPVSAEVSGKVVEVNIQENQQVTAGQVLFRLDPAPFQLAVAKAEAKMAQAKTDLDVLKAQYVEKQAEVALARTRYDFAEKEETRQADLVSRHYVSKSSYDNAQQAAELAAQEITASEKDLKRIAEALGGNINGPIEQYPNYRAALAELDQAKLDLARVEVRASLPGTVNEPPKAGQHVDAGDSVMALVASGNLWVEANFIETDLTYVHPGQSATVQVDTYPGVTWHGHVDSLSPATGAEFSLLPAQNTTGNWVKIAQRVPVRIALDPAPDLPKLRAGLSTEVKIDTQHRRQILGLSL
ncbi:MAG: HlyD family secretion protein [Gammaproteobacteria bacterium]|nr:HlyD family secretion protein [Gammaproteobacteria bacterium]MCP5425688.1 HlyD family secretion protein [Gammaproteobacteria bacterium]MCP5459719.1 HlyD family secretion protein [Gammaproteobacteria bacterium]